MSADLSKLKIDISARFDDSRSKSELSEESSYSIGLLLARKYAVLEVEGRSVEELEVEGRSLEDWLAISGRQVIVDTWRNGHL